jgi:acetoacetyl-CoA synthetase
MGTSEIYQAVGALDEILDSLVIDLELLGRESYMPLFVVLREGIELDDELRNRIKQTIRQNVSPRHVPNEIFVIEEVPYTLSGKKMEVPIRKILLGHNIKKARNPQTLDYFIEFAKGLEAK